MATTKHVLFFYVVILQHNSCSLWFTVPPGNNIHVNIFILSEWVRTYRHYGTRREVDHISHDFSIHEPNMHYQCSFRRRYTMLF